MARLIWTRQAVIDLGSIAEFIAQDSPRYAKLTVRRIRAAARRLTRLPFSGRVVPELNNQVIREIIVGNYRVIHSVHVSETVQVITVHHSARMLDVDALQKYLFE